jgi:DedD protein
MMERALKERIIGAVVLVVFVVLVVPIFLDGPPADGETVTERVLLPGQDGQKTQTVVLDRDRTEPVPAASAPQEETPRAEEEPAQVVIERNEPLRVPPKPVPQPVQDEPASQPPSQPATSTTGMWAVQISALSNKESAESQAAGLRKEGYAAFVSQYQSGSSTLYRVRIGPQKDRDSAEAMAVRLLKAGHKGQVVPHP